MVGVYYGPMTTTQHTANLATDVAADWTNLYTAWCPCGWIAAEAHAQEDLAQADAAAHVDAPHGTATDPWSGETITLAEPLPPLTETERRAYGAETCRCGYDLCGTCASERRAGLRPPLQKMATFGAGRA